MTEQLTGPLKRVNWIVSQPLTFSTIDWICWKKVTKDRIGCPLECAIHLVSMHVLLVLGTQWNSVPNNETSGVNVCDCLKGCDCSVRSAVTLFCTQSVSGYWHWFVGLYRGCFTACFWPAAHAKRQARNAHCPGLSVCKTCALKLLLTVTCVPGMWVWRM